MNAGISQLKECLTIASDLRQNAILIDRGQAIYLLEKVAYASPVLDGRIYMKMLEFGQGKVYRDSGPKAIEKLTSEQITEIFSHL